MLKPALEGYIYGCPDTDICGVDKGYLSLLKSADT
jgi:hypothetical protein